MKIKISSKLSSCPQIEPDTYYADPIDLPGTPPQGIGYTETEAIGSLILAMQHESIWEKCGWPKFEIKKSDYDNE